jgi:adenosylmethionine-8-amino-7-oxononanoate aminotransferase
MKDLLILGTDTDAGKTTFALLWMSVFADVYEYWKPVETGPSDSELIARLVPEATVHPPRQRFEAPVAPPLAASMQGTRVQNAPEIARARPSPTQPGRRLMIETFGSPFSPLTDGTLQLALIDWLAGARVLVVSSTLGAIGRTLQCARALACEDLAPHVIVLVGPRDDYATWTIFTNRTAQVFSLQPPPMYDAATIKRCADEQRGELEAIAEALAYGLSSVLRPPDRPAHAGDALDGDHWVWHPYTSLRDPTPPLPCAEAVNEFLLLEDGRHVIDAISSWWTILHGHRDPDLMHALRETADRIDHVQFAGVTHRWAVELAEWLVIRQPAHGAWGGGRVFFSDNGSTAVEVALKMAYQFWCHQGEPRRTRFVGFEHGYHGDTFGAMAVSRDPVFFGRFEPLLFQADILPLDPTRLDEHLAKHRGTIAAVIVEPLVQGAGGMRMHTPKTLAALAEVSRRHDVLLIADEVMTGGGRTGTLWAYEQAGIAPDLVCAAKTLAGGVLPLAATIVSHRVEAVFDTSDRTRTLFHGHSFTANPLACAVACANLRLMELPETLQKPRAMEKYWTEVLEPLRAMPHVKDVRVCGSIAAVELDVPGGYLADVGRTMHAKALSLGVMLRPLGSVLYAMPPFCTSMQSLERIAAAMHAAVNVVRD